MDAAPAGLLASRDFAHIARALAGIEHGGSGQPTLPAMAAAAGLSPDHFDQLFHGWAGIRPAGCLQVLAASAPGSLRWRRLLPSTLLEVMSPAQTRPSGEGLALACGIARSPFGWLLSAETPRGLCHLSFTESPAVGPALALLRARWPAAQLQWQPGAAEALSARLWIGAAGSAGPLRLCVRGTRFQLRVWQALLALAPGERTSYAGLAARVGAPHAARAVGGAVAANPIAWLIPCHRVLRADGTLGGYHWGPERKRAMLAWERLRGATLQPLSVSGSGGA